MGNRSKRGVVKFLAIMVLFSSAQGRDFGGREAQIWRTVEWKIEDVDCRDNPFDAASSVTFTHIDTGRKRTTGMFYDGDKTWKFRFTGTVAGKWQFSTASDIPALDGHRGTIRVSANTDPKIKGFLTYKGNRFAIQRKNEDDLHGYIFNAYMSRVKHPACLEDFGSDLTKVTNAVRAYFKNARDNGFEIVFVHVNSNWFKFGVKEHNKHDSENPDPVSFRVLETIIKTVHGMGGRVHIWAWGDESRKWTPIGVPGGINGPVDRRLQRYIAARLGPLPGWTMGHGFDLHEWTNSRQLNEWAEFLHEQFGWQHLLCSRGYRLKGPHNMNSYDGFGRNVELASTQHGPKDYAEIAEDLDSDTTRPHFYEERHSYKRDGFDLDMDGTRRLLWAESMAGGIGGFFGFYPTSPHPYPNPEQLRTHYQFWHPNRRFTLDMRRANHLTKDGFALYSPSTNSMVIYCPKTSTIRFDRSRINGQLPAVAVDTKKPYKEIDLGTLASKDNKWTAPYASDWAIAIGDFKGSAATKKSGPCANALPGQIIVHPDHPEWLMRKGGEPFLMCGPGDPEGFLYLGKLRPDGTRDGDQMKLIDKLKGTGANCIYLMAVRSHGGDGDGTENPFTDHDPAKGINSEILDQWELWFTEMDNAGIVIYFFIYDDSARLWRTGDSVGQAESQFLQTLVNRFEHHKNLIWCIAEEYGESLSAKRVSNIAAAIRAADDHDHVIAVHKNHGLEFSEFADDRNIDQFAVQYNVETAEQLHAGMVKAWKDSSGRYNLNMSEAKGFGTGSDLRRKCWACAMAGAHVMILEMDIESTPVDDLEACGHLVRFFESANFNEMAPHDELAHGSTEYVLADPGKSYIAYTSNREGEIGLKDMRAGIHDLIWLDCVTGRTARQEGIKVTAGSWMLPRPRGIGDECAVYIRRR